MTAAGDAETSADADRPAQADASPSADTSANADGATSDHGTGSRSSTDAAGPRPDGSAVAEGSPATGDGAQPNGERPPARTGSWLSPWRIERRRGLDPEDRKRVMEAVALRTGAGWGSRFAVMMALSVVVAVMGLSADSAAVVIGAMLLAPLMTPVLGLAAALAMGLSRHMVRSAAIVVAASAEGIVLAGVLALLLPGGELSEEVLARTSPDLRDLLVALAAGTAGAYATVRRDVSSSLPGVAVAVALVPPLATVGMTLEAGRTDLASGAMLLYLANLAAIVLVSVGVFVFTGFVPPRRLARKGWRVLGGGAFAGMATVAVAVPLGLASYNAALAGETRADLLAAAESWTQGTGDRVDELRVDDNVVLVEISGPNQPADTETFLRAVQQIMGPDTEVRISWTQTQDAGVTDAEAAATAAALDPDELRERLVELVDEWFTSGSEGAYDIGDVQVDEKGIRLDIISAAPPPPASQLSELVSVELGIDVPIEVEWIGRTSVEDLPSDDNADDAAGDDASTGGTGEDGDDSDENGQATSLFAIGTELRTAARRWAATETEVDVIDLRYDGVTVVVDLIGTEPPPIDELEEAVADIVPDAELSVWFTERQRLTDAPDAAQPASTDDAPTTDDPAPIADTGDEGG